jgi:RNA polymerase sigma-70 factor (ECF subfamily)
MMHANDPRRLLERARGGDREAFEELVRRHRGRLEAVIRYRVKAPLRARVELEDLVQESLLRALRGIGRFEGDDEEAFARWLSAIGVNVVLEAASWCGRDPRVPLDDELGGIAADEAPPERALRREERFERLEDALRSLSPDHRRVLLLVRVDGLSVAEAARRMGRSANAVSHLLLRASRQLRAAFGDTASLHLPPRRLPDAAEAGGAGDAT